MRWVVIAAPVAVLVVVGILIVYFWPGRGTGTGSGSADRTTSATGSAQPPTTLPPQTTSTEPSRTATSTPVEPPPVAPPFSSPAPAPPESQTPSTTPATPTALVYEAAYVDVPPVVVRQVKPAYPPQARKRKIEDTVVLKVLVNESGSVQSIRILRGSLKEPAFNSAAISAVRQWAFRPARLGGKNVSCWYPVALAFRLSS